MSKWEGREEGPEKDELDKFEAELSELEEILETNPKKRKVLDKEQNVLEQAAKHVELMLEHRPLATWQVRRRDPHQADWRRECNQWHSGERDRHRLRHRSPRE